MILFEYLCCNYRFETIKKNILKAIFLGCHLSVSRSVDAYYFKNVQILRTSNIQFRSTYTANAEKEIFDI